MKVVGDYFNPGYLKIFQMSLRALSHTPLQLVIVIMNVFVCNEIEGQTANYLFS